MCNDKDTQRIKNDKELCVKCCKPKDECICAHGSRRKYYTPQTKRRIGFGQTGSGGRSGIGFGQRN